MITRSKLPAVAEAEDELVEPGFSGGPLSSGFEYRQASDFPQLRLSEAARRSVLEKMDSVDEARLRAAESSSHTYIG